MDKIKNQTLQLLESIKLSLVTADIEAKNQEISQLEAELARPEIWNNPSYAQQKSRQLGYLKKIVQPWQTIRVQVEDILQLIEIDNGDLLEEFQEQLIAFETDYAQLRKSLLFDGKYDNHGAIVRITAGVGGVDAQDFAEMLERMYLRWAEKNNLETDFVERSSGDEAGLKTSVFEVEGLFAYGKLRSEHGVHRLVRISPFNSGGSRETSFALVEVLPKIEAPDEIIINDKDLKIDVYRAGGHGGQSVNTTDSAVRITHLPTNITVAIQNERSQIQNKETALKILRSKLAQLQLDQRTSNLEDLQAGKSAEWGAQIRNYVLNPYKLVKDVRTKYEEKDTDKVFGGDINNFIEAYLELKLES